MARFFSFFHFFLSWWGAFVLAALDSTVFFSFPFGNDAVVVYLAARDRDLFWLYPLLSTAGSLTGAAITYWIGRKVGEVGLERFVATRRLKRLKNRVKDAGAFAMALPALLPPPFPLMPFVLTCGALEVDRSRFFLIFGAARVIRFGAEALLARTYGERVLRVLESDTFQIVVAGLIILAVAATVVSGVTLWRSAQREA